MQHLALSGLDLKGIVLAGLADLKSELLPMLSPPLASIVIKVVDIAYGGERGFQQAIEEASEVLRDVPLVRDRALISHYMEEIAKDTKKYTFGVSQTLMALEMGVAECVIVWDKLPLTRYRIVDATGREMVVVQRDLKDHKVKIVEQMSFIDWLLENCEKSGAELRMITDTSPETRQFCMGFGGFGALLRYPVDFPDPDEDVDSNSDVARGVEEDADNSDFL